MKNIACIDLEGVLMPEMWPYIGQVAGIPGLAATTREEPDYPKLMRQRIALLRQHGLRLADVQRIIDKMEPLEGAIAFIATLQRHYRIVILSDAFHELADHLEEFFYFPEFQCHRLNLATDGFIDSCDFLPRKGKEEVVQGFLDVGHQTLAVGDALNDLGMLRLATDGFLFRPSEETRRQAPDLTVAQSYEEILNAVCAPARMFALG